MVVSVTGPWNYAIFTDQPTLGDPIKFAFPPFSRIPTKHQRVQQQLRECFLPAYTTPNSGGVDGWTVRSNYVGIITDTKRRPKRFQFSSRSAMA